LYTPRATASESSAPVLAHWQDAARRDVGVLEQLEGDEAVVRRGLGIVEDGAELLQMAGAQQVRDVVEGVGGQRRDRLRRHLQHRMAVEAGLRDMIAGELAVLRGVVGDLDQVAIGEFGHAQAPGCSGLLLL
jgi:hypothetical protein